MKKLIKKIFFMFIIFILLVFLYFLYKGYSLYNTKIAEISIDSYVDKIRNRENFTKLQDVPEEYKNAVIAVEDHRFENHGAVDYIALARAIFVNIKSKQLTQGGSTITQQVAKNLYFIEDGDGPDRKIAEFIVANELEKKYSKDEILELYINIIYFGDGYYCIGDAAQGYFSKKPSEMNLYECTLLAGIPNAPSAYSPTVNPKLATERQKKVISSMVEHGYLTQEEADSIIAE